MAKLYIILTILCVFGAVLVKGFDKEEAIAKFMTTTEACKTEVGAKDTDIEELVSKKPASSMEGKCLRSCIMKKFQVMDNNGKLDKEVALSHAEKFTDGAEDKMKIAKEIVDACANINVSTDHCEAAHQYCKCLTEQATAHGLKDDLEF